MQRMNECGWSKASDHKLGLIVFKYQQDRQGTRQKKIEKEREKEREREREREETDSTTELWLTRIPAWNSLRELKTCWRRKSFADASRKCEKIPWKFRKSCNLLLFRYFSFSLCARVPEIDNVQDVEKKELLQQKKSFSRCISFFLSFPFFSFHFSFMVGIITIDSLFLDIYRTRSPSIPRHARHLFPSRSFENFESLLNYCYAEFDFD